MSLSLSLSSRAHWQRDADAKACNYCQQEFTFTRRRHHCRACGRLYCDRCCPKPSRPTFTGGEATCVESPRLVRIRSGGAPPRARAGAPPAALPSHASPHASPTAGEASPSPSGGPSPRLQSPQRSARGLFSADALIAKGAVGEEEVVEVGCERVCAGCLLVAPDPSTLAECWEVGTGSFGTVVAGMLPDARFCAVKHLTLHGSEAGVIKEFHKEIGVMRSLRHRHIVQYLGSHLSVDADARGGCASPRVASPSRSGHCMSPASSVRLTIYLEYVSGGSLSGLMQELPGGHLPLDNARVWSRHMLDGLGYLHGSGIAHRDIKCDNILVCFDTGHAKLADFGTAWDPKAKRGKGWGKLGGGARKATTFVGTPHWMAPEVFLAGSDDGADGRDDEYDAMKADVWSVGCTVFEMLSGRAPWRPTALMALVEAMEGGTGRDAGECVWPDAVDPAALPTDVVDLLRCCFLRDPSARPTVAALTNHIFVAHTEALEKVYRVYEGRAVEGATELARRREGEVCAAILPTGQVIAAKRTVAADLDGDEFKDRLKEVALLQHIQHRNVVKYIGHSTRDLPGSSEVELTLWLEYVTGGSLRQLLDRMPEGRLPLGVVRVYTRHVLDALTFLHSRNIAHRSIKAEHVLISLDRGLAKLCTLSAAADLANRSDWTALDASGRRAKVQSLAGTPDVMAPEIAAGWVRDTEGYDPMKADIWSVGCMVSEMFTGKKPWTPFTHLLTAITALIEGDGWPDVIEAEREALPSDLASFLDLCFRRDPAQRPGPELLLAHAFLN